MQRKALRRRSLGVAIAVAAIGLAVAVAAAPAVPPRTAKDLHDARYCEILVLEGTIPDATVTVWNTIGLNRCPAPWWDSLDAETLADELGAGAVILNGPRYFLMDEATGRSAEVRSFAGRRLRSVATIPIRSVADLAQVSYAERTVERRNSWQWNRGRRVYKLLAPDGTRYLMQAYSQIRDPELAIGDLRSLGDRLELPLGWRYRTHLLRRDLVLRARGEATIVQDELLNTYQRLPRSQRTAPSRPHRIQITGSTRTVDSPKPGTLLDTGTVAGAPFGPGSITLEVSLAGTRASGPFRIDSPRGSAFGAVEMSFEISGSEISFEGTASFTGGTGRFRGIKGDDLRAYDHNTLDGQSGTFTLDGFATY